MPLAALGRRLLAALGIALALAAADGLVPCFAAETPAAPQIEPRLKALVDRHLRSDPDYVPGDILSRSNVEPILGELIERGISPSHDNDGLYNEYLRDDDYLVEQLRSPEGRRFMRKIQTLPGAYDRLERFARHPKGRLWIRQLIAAENGPELFAEMISEAGLKQAAEAMGDDEQSRNLNRPTGRVHTEAQLLARLQRSLMSQSRAARDDDGDK
jgi:hypothetical protein